MGWELEASRQQAPSSQRKATQLGPRCAGGGPARLERESLSSRAMRTSSESPALNPKPSVSGLNPAGNMNSGGQGQSQYATAGQVPA